MPEPPIAREVIDEYTDAKARVNARLARLTDAPNRDLAEKEAAVLAMLSARESAAATNMFVELLRQQLRVLESTINVLGEKADQGSDRLVFATWALAIAAVTAALIGAYATLTVKPEIITVSAPTPPSVVFTSAPVIAPPVPAQAAPR
jgi:predicted Zn-dependent peptidase